MTRGLYAELRARVSEKAFRLDFFIAIAALLVSAASTIALIYKTRVIGAQYAATIWGTAIAATLKHGLDLRLRLRASSTGSVSK
jgi:hypothetical protein